MSEQQQVIAVIQPVNADDEPDYETAERHPSDEANAVLLAAAPRLFSALKAVIEAGLVEVESDCIFPGIDHWAEDSEYPAKDWQAEVAAGDTRLSYREWVAGMKEWSQDSASQEG